MVADDVVADLRRRFDEFTLTQKRIAEVIVEDPEFVAFSTVDKLGTRLGISPSTIVRFAYRIGLDGYQDLQERVRQKVRQQIRSGTGGEVPDAIPPQLAGTIFAESAQRDLDNMRRTVAGATASDLDAAVRLLREARRIYLIGHLTSEALTLFAGLALGRLRGDTMVLENRTQLGSAVLEATTDDVFLVFSFPPYAGHTLHAVEAATARGFQVIAVTDSPVSPCGQRADLVLSAHSSGVVAPNSLVAPLVILNALINGVAAASPGGLERYRAVMASISAWDPFVLGETGAP